MNRKEGTKHRKRKSNKLKILFWAILFAFVSVLILYLFSLGGENGIAEILNMRDYWLSVGVANGLILIGYLMMYRVDAQNIALNENDLEDTEWLSVKRLKKLKEFQVYDYKAADGKQDGIVIGAEKKGGNVEVITTSQLHALIVGTTGSGKTTGFVDQNIAVLGKSQSKPSIVISDPKKELYEKHAKNLEKQGYKISVLDLREPYSSERWNPMNVLLRRIRLVKDLENNLEQKDGKYYGAGEVFLSYRDARTRMQELKDEIYENAQDLVYTLCPVQNKDQPTWEQGARNLIFGFVLAMCEDCIKGKLDEKQLVLFNVYHNICKYCSEDTTMLKKYLMEGRDEFSKVRGLVNTVLITSDKTLTSYLSEVNSYMQQLSDDGIMSMTAENDLDIVNLDEQPNAVFIIVPDERFTRHRFVTLFITQMYKELVEKANLNLRRGEKDTAILKRNTYFVLDEFANLPKFDNIEGMVTVARSRGIRFLFVLQSYSQLTAKYGRDVGDIIKTNCNVIGLSLLRGATYPNPDSDVGVNTFTYSLYPHTGALRNSEAEKQAFMLNNPITVIGKTEDIRPFSFVQCSDERINIGAVKKAEEGNGFIVRLNETNNMRHKIRLNFGKTIESAFICDLMEQKEKRLAVANNEVLLEIKPFEIITLMVE